MRERRELLMVLAEVMLAGQIGLSGAGIARADDDNASDFSQETAGAESSGDKSGTAPLNGLSAMQDCRLDSNGNPVLGVRVVLKLGEEGLVLGPRENLTLFVQEKPDGVKESSEIIGNPTDKQQGFRDEIRMWFPGPGVNYLQRSEFREGNWFFEVRRNRQ